MKSFFKLSSAPSSPEAFLNFVKLSVSGAVAVFLSSALISCTQKSSEDVVNLAIWGNYLNEDFQKEFQTATGLKLNMTNYSSNEELLARVQMGSSGVDVAVPSDYMVQIMRKLDLLAPLDSTQIQMRKDLDPALLNKNFDPENKFSLPFSWTTTGIAVHRGLFKGKLNSWKDFFENPELQGKIAVMDDVRESLGSVLKRQGYSVNSTSSAELENAKTYYVQHKKQIKMFTSDTVEILKNKEVFAAQSYSSDALQAQRSSSGEIEFIIPEEGSTIAIDHLVIFKNSQRQKQAHALINFILQKKINQKLVSEKLFGPVFKDVAPLLPDSLRKNKGLFPDDKTRTRLEFIEDQGEENKKLEDIWMKIKSARIMELRKSQRQKA